MWFFIIMGVVLSCLHQSSLGNLMVIAPYKMHPLWYTPLLPLLFLVSAIGVGLPMVIFESTIAAKVFKFKLESEIIQSLSRIVPVIIGIYLFLKIGDLTIRDAWAYMFEGSYQSNWFLLEFFIGIVAPLLMFMSAKVRRSPKLIFTASTLYIIFGVLLNRINVFLVAYKPPYAEKAYFPAIGEFAVTIGLVAALILCYRAFVTIFPILPGPQADG
ncbi:hypothetical protein GF337_07825 [candidate division KSB1 bacterium]|nr:hypothetical protein [candidate division KSB1 bacterium]